MLSLNFVLFRSKVDGRRPTLFLREVLAADELLLWLVGSGLLFFVALGALNGQGFLIAALLV